MKHCCFFTLILFLGALNNLNAQTETTAKNSKRTEYKIEKAKACSLEINSTTLGDSTLLLYSYDVVINNKGSAQTYSVKGSGITAEISNYLCKAQIGDKFYIENIKLKKEDDSFIVKPPITYIIE